MFGYGSDCPYSKVGVVFGLCGAFLGVDQVECVGCGLAFVVWLFGFKHLVSGSFGYVWWCLCCMWCRFAFLRIDAAVGVVFVVARANGGLDMGTSGWWGGRRCGLHWLP